MEIDITTLFNNDIIKFNNYDTIKNTIATIADKYKDIVVSPATIKNASEDRAYLNKISKALNDRRILLQKDYMEPFNNFKVLVDNLIEPIEVVSDKINEQIKSFEVEEKNNKRLQIQELFNDIFRDLINLVNFESIFN